MTPTERVHREMRTADDRWGPGAALLDGTWLAVLTEEVGEVARELCDAWPGTADTVRLRDELAQVAAVAIRWMQALEHRSST